ncbi:hypothetical protein CPC197_0211 [Chlamydia psittaci C1/97]|nr:hypothetical protein CPC197_0211 [Chlamydia psittaci C1/97]
MNKTKVKKQYLILRLKLMLASAIESFFAKSLKITPKSRVPL